MPVGVAQTEDGHVAIVDMETGKRWDMTPEMADVAANQCRDAAASGASNAMIICDCLEERQFRFGGGRDDLIKMFIDLGLAANAARAAWPANDQGQD